MLSYIFPGQGGQRVAMYRGLRDLQQFRLRYQMICDHTHTDVLRRVECDEPHLLDQNLFSTLITVLVSSVSLDQYRDANGAAIDCVAGYSAGQWSAFYAAGLIEFEPMVAALVEWARLCDDCALRDPGGMYAVMGVPEKSMEALLTDLRAKGHRAFVSNFNGYAQYSISCAQGSLETLEAALTSLGPKRLMRIACAGAWHCPILDPVEGPFREYLEKLPVGEASVRVVDTVTGSWLDTDAGAVRTSLARNCNHPVRWSQSIELLLEAGCRDFVELGFGNTLSTFGYFINGDANWQSFHSPRRQRRVTQLPARDLEPAAPLKAHEAT